MSLITATYVAIFVFLLIYVILKVARQKARQTKEAHGTLSVRLAALIAGLAFLRKAAAIAAFCFGGLSLILWLSERLDIDFSGGPALVFFDVVMQFDAALSKVGDWWSYALISVLLISLVILIWQQTRRSATADEENAFTALVVSPQLRKVIGRWGGWMANLGLALFFLLLLGTPIANQFALRLDDIVINRVKEEASADLQFARQKQSESPEPSESEPDQDALDNAVDQVARAFEDALANTAVFHPLKPPKGPDPSGGGRSGSIESGASADRAPNPKSEIKRHAVRDEILQRAQRSAPASVNLERPPSIWDVAARNDAERRLLALERASAIEQGPVTSIGKEFRARLSRELSTASPAVRTSFVSNVKASAPRYRNAVEAGSRLAVEVFGMVFDGSMSGTDDLVESLLRNVTKSSLEPSVQRAGEIVMEKALARSLEVEGLGNFPEQVARDLEQTRFMPARDSRAFSGVASRVPSSENIWHVASTHPPSLHSRPVAGQFDRAVEISERLASKAVARGDPGYAARLTDSIVTYGDYFPGRIGEEATTRRGEVLARVVEGSSGPDVAPPRLLNEPGGGPSAGGGGGGGPGTTESRSSGKQAYRSSATRARSFGRLRGFARVGGVLIGRDPDTVVASGPDIIGISWQGQGPEIQFQLVSRDGKTLDLGPYPRSLVHSALSYAADGRPVTVTMTAAPPLVDLRILMHPSLIDTPIGCRAIELDRFVDQFTDRSARESDFLAKAERLAQSHLDLYDVAVETRTRAVYDALLQSRGTDYEVSRAEERVEAMSDRISQALSAGHNPGALDYLPGDLGTLYDASSSPIAGKPKFFDQSTVKAMAACRSTRTVDGFSGCLVDRLRLTDESMSDLLTLLDEVARPGPGNVVWSGVRERRYLLDPHLDFLKQPTTGTTADQLWPFEFIFQVAFDAGPLTGWAEQSVVEDESPWEFPQTKDSIASAVAAGTRSGREAEILERMAEFTILQRLFRLALAGDLGENFPIARLVALTEDTKSPPDAAATPTPRWTARPGWLEQRFAETTELTMSEVRVGERPWLESYSSRLNQCSKLIERTDDLAAIDNSIWRKSCQFSPATERAAKEECESKGNIDDSCRVYALIFNAATVADARDLRLNLDVKHSELVSKEIGVSGCPTF